MPLLETRDVHFAYGRMPVLCGVTLSVTQGEVVSLLGPNGSGKSTLLKLLLGLHRPKHGEVLFDGTSLTQIAPRALAKRVAYVPQLHSAAFPYNVLEVVVMGRIAYRPLFSTYSRDDLRIAIHALEMLGISHLRHRTYTELSGGERQLTLIARALTQGADIIVMDEPVSGLDYGNQLRLLEQIGTLARDGYTFIMSTHFPDHALLVSSRVVMLQRGTIFEDGAPAAVVTRENLRTLYDIEAEIVHFQDGSTFCMPKLAGRLPCTHADIRDEAGTQKREQSVERTRSYGGAMNESPRQNGQGECPPDASRFAELSELSQVLAERDQETNRVLECVERKLVGMGLDLETWLWAAPLMSRPVMTDGEAQCIDEIVGFGRLNGRSALLVKQVTHASEPGWERKGVSAEGPARSLREAERELRILAVGKLDHLVNTLAEQARSVVCAFDTGRKAQKHC